MPSKEIKSQRRKKRSKRKTGQSINKRNSVKRYLEVLTFFDQFANFISLVSDDVKLFLMTLFVSLLLHFIIVKNEPDQYSLNIFLTIKYRKIP